MKSLRFLFVLLIFFPCFVLGQWTQIPSGTTSFLVDLSFVNPNAGWVAGHNRTLLKTTNGGQNWTTSTPINSGDILSVFFINEQTGWIGSSTGLIYKTTNGGASWSQQYNANFKWITKIFFVNETTGFATIHKYDPDPFLREGAIIKTTNGGQSWTIKTQVFSDGFQCIHFPDPENGFAVGTWGMFTRTSNGGETWSNPVFLTNNWFHSVFFIDKYTGFAAGGGFTNTLIFKTTNNGNSWALVRSTNEGGILGITFLDDQKGWACGYNGTMLKSTNAGSNWSTENSSVNSAIGEMVMFPNTGLAVGEFGVVLKYGQQGSTNISIIQPNGGEILTSGSTYEILWNSQDVVDVKIEFTSNNGQNWTTIIDSIPSTGIYNWAVPQVVSSQCKIRISDKSDPGIFSVSNGTFSIQSSRLINVIQPNGGEVIPGGSNYEIQWNSNDVEYVKLEYSINNGASWNIIVDSVPSVGIYTWTVPNIQTIQGRIKISDITMPSISDISDNTFRIDHSVDVNEWHSVTEFGLNQNYPNPFNPSTVISFSIPVSEYVTIKIYDMLGNEVGVIVNEELPAGTHTAELRTDGLSSGTYFYRMQAGSYSDTKKMIFLK